MKLLESSPPSKEILEQLRRSIDKSALYCNSDNKFCAIYDHLSDYAVLAKRIREAMPLKRTILHLDEYGIWPESENWFIFDSLCMFLFGRTHRVMPMEFEEDELEAGSSILQISLQFGWGGIYISDISNWFCFNHDGFLISATSKRVEDRFRGLPGVRNWNS